MNVELDRLRAEIEAAETEGGEFSTDEVLRNGREGLDKVFRPHNDDPSLG